MSTIFVRPGHLHVPKKVLRATSEQGLTTAPAEPDAANKGALRIRVSGTPYSDVAQDLQIVTGGNPTGYATGQVGTGAGTAVIQRKSGAGADQWLGHVDTPFLVRAEFPIAYDTNHLIPSTPRTLANGFLGVLVPTATNHEFHRIDPSDGSIAKTVIPESIGSPRVRSDFVVLASGRLVALLYTGGSANDITTYSSDDNGATWALLGLTEPGTSGAAREILCAEAIGDIVVCIQASITGATTANLLISRDFGATYTSIDIGTTLTNPRTCVANGQLLVAHRAASSVKVYQVAPGGGFPSSVINTTAAAFGAVAIATRDDGTVWAWGWEASAAGTLDMDISVSLDGGLSWADPQTTTPNVLDLETAAYGATGYDSIQAGTWEGKIIMLATVDSALRSSNAIHFLTWGEWSSVTESRRGDYYEHTFTPVAFPQDLGWTRSFVGAGATVTNTGPLKIAQTAGDSDDYRSPGSFWTTAAGDERTIRFRFRVNSGGGHTTNIARLLFAMDDGVNKQEVIIAFGTATMRTRDGNGAAIGGDVSADLTKWTELIIGFKHDATAGVGRLDVVYKVDGSDTYTRWHTAAVVPETAAATFDGVRFGGSSGGAVDWDVAILENSPLSKSFLFGYTNPAKLEGRPLAAAFDYFVVDGVHIGGVNGGAVPGDLYDLASTYSYGTDSLWLELRPSRSLRSKVDGTVWEVVFDAGALDLFKADIAALFRTNFQDCQFQMNATDAWGGPSVDVALSSTVFTGTADSSGPGYAKVVGFPQFRPHEFRSDGDAHRWFVVFDTIGGNVHYEITDNDTDRVYIDGVDLTTIIKPGKFEIYGNRMASPLGGFQQHRFARISVAAIDTADKYFEVGTPIFDVLFQPTVSYDWGFVDRLEANTELLVTDGGYRSSSRQGPRRSSVAVQWPVIDRIGKAKDLDQQITDFYGAIEGSHTPIVYWRDDTDNGETLQLVRVLEVLSISNTLGEGANQAGRVDQLRLSEEW